MEMGFWCQLLRRHYSSTSLKSLATHLRDNSKRVMVMAGAGLSTPSGIPDFRSQETGLYSNLEKYKLPYPEAIFDLSFFANNPAPFLDLAKTIYPDAGNFKPNKAHYFVRLLEQKGILLRMYTQNIDGLERLSGLNEDMLVEAHGGFNTASCIACGKKKDETLVKTEILSGKVPRCQHCNNLVKPDIVFFGELLPERFGILSQVDTLDTDFLLVMGTSLAVFPFANLVEMVPDDVPRLLINRSSVGGIGSRSSDYLLSGDIVEQVTQLSEEIGWSDDLNKLCEMGEKI